jgi:hypothetical protein
MTGEFSDTGQGGAGGNAGGGAGTAGAGSGQQGQGGQQGQQTGSGATGGSFSPEQQQQINQIVSRRVNEVKAGYADVEKKAAILDNLFKDQNFISWLEDGQGQSSSSTGGQQQTGNNQGLEGVETIQDLVKALPTMIAQTVQPMLKPFEQTNQSVQAMTRATAMQTEIQRMSTAVDQQTGQLQFPYLHDSQFRAEVEKIIQDGRAWRLDDAYALANGDRQRSGAGVPNTAFLLNSRFGGGGGLDNGGRGEGGGKPDFGDAPKFSNPREALAYVAKKYNY